MFGVHVNKEGRQMDNAIIEEMKRLTDYAGDIITAPCAQIFVTGPRTYKVTIDEKTAERIKKLNIPIVFHGAYVDRPWSGNEMALKNIYKELQIGNSMSANGLVLHLSSSVNVSSEGSSESSSEGSSKSSSESSSESSSVKDTFIINLKKITERSDGMIIWLETHTAKPSKNTFETPEKIAKLFKRIHQSGIKNVGLCIDTAHLFSCGMALYTREDAVNWIQAVSVIGVPLMFHLNDSASKLASGIDKHAPICHGEIWKQYHTTTGDFPFKDSGVCAIIEYCMENKLMMIFERHNDDVCKDLKILADMCNHVEAN